MKVRAFIKTTVVQERKHMLYKFLAVLPLLLVSICFPNTPRCIEESLNDATSLRDDQTRYQQTHYKNYSPYFYYPNLSNNPAINQNMREKIWPHLLPLNHTMKPILDSIFSKSRAIETESSLIRAGFSIVCAQKNGLIIVAKHPQVPGYLFKIYPDSIAAQKNGMFGWELLTTRCVVAKKIRALIKRKKLRHFTVADKWLYPLPIQPKSQYANQETLVLLVKDMHICSKRKSKRMWRTKATRTTLKQLYSILGRGYGSAYLANNIPYTKRGKFAFIDTEYDKRDISLWLVNHFLSKKMRRCWNSILEEHEPQPEPPPAPTPAPPPPTPGG
jgi:hypothetical protein